MSSHLATLVRRLRVTVRLPLSVALVVAASLLPLVAPTAAEASGTWGSPVTLPHPATAANRLTVVSCPERSQCVSVGSGHPESYTYGDPSVPVAAMQRDGQWGSKIGRAHV